MFRFLICSVGMALILFHSKGQTPVPITDIQTIRTLVDSNRFEMQYTIATTHHTFYLQPMTPYTDQNIRISQDSAFIVIRDNRAAGYLPYYGSGYAMPQTGPKGIVFSNTMTDLNKSIKGKGRHPSISYQFSVAGKNDAYKINIDIRYNGQCYLYINSLRRSPISYIGQIVEKVF